MKCAKVHTFHILLILVWQTAIVSIVHCMDYQRAAKKSACLNPPRTARRVESVISECQEDIKSKMVNEAFQIMREVVVKEHPRVPEHMDNLMVMAPVQKHEDEEEDEDEADMDVEEKAPSRRRKRQKRLIHHIRRVGALTTDIYNPTLVPFEDKRIAGCLLHCVYAKNNAIDYRGWPTLDGLVDFYSEGVNEHGFFMATLRSVNLCLRAVTLKYKIDRRRLPERGESCDLAFDVFDCISDQITGYCMDHYRH